MLNFSLTFTGSPFSFEFGPQKFLVTNFGNPLTFKRERYSIPQEHGETCHKPAALFLYNHLNYSLRSISAFYSLYKSAFSQLLGHKNKM